MVLTIVCLPLLDGGSNESFVPLVQGVTFGAVLWLLLKDHVEFDGYSRLLMGVVALSLAAAAISTAFSEDLDASVPLLIQWLWLGGTAILALTVAKQRRGRELLLALLGAALLIQLLWSFFVWWGGRSPARLHVGTFYAPNQYAGYVLLLAPILLSIYLFSRGFLRIAGFGMLTALAYLSLFLSGSRGGTVAALVGVLVVGILAVTRERWVALIKVIALGPVFVILGFFSVMALFSGPPHTEGPFDAVLSKSETVSSSTLARWRWAQGAWQIGVDQPLTGSGLGTFGDKFSQIQDPDWRWSRYAHNHYLESFAEGGVLLLLASASLPIVAIAGVARRLKAVSPEEFEWCTALFGGLVGGSLHLLVDHDWSYPAYASAFVLLAVLTSGVGRANMEAQATERRWPQVIAVPALLSLLAIAAQVTSRGLVSGDLMVVSGGIRRARVASALAPYSITPQLLEADELVKRCESGDLKRAQRALSIAASIDQLNPVVHWKIAFVMTQQGFLESARASYRTALQIAPNSAEAYLRAASLELTVGQSPRANSILDEGIARLEGTVNGALVDSLKDLREAAPLEAKETEHSNECSVLSS